MVKFNEDRKMGVEIEFIMGSGITRRKVIAKLNANGIPAIHSGYYTDWSSEEARNSWVVKFDGSIGERGAEVVSPPIKGSDFHQTLKTVMRVLREECGGRVTRHCGIHVHHDISDFTLKSATNLMQMYKNHEAVIDQLVPPSRRGNRNRDYCSSLLANPLVADGYHKAQREGKLAKKMTDYTIQSVEFHSFGFNVRGAKVNMTAFTKHGTVEFRHHGGSLNANKVWSWMVFTQAMVETSFRRTRVSQPSREVSALHPWVGEWRALQREMNMLKSRDRDEVTQTAMEYLRKRAHIYGGRRNVAD